VTDDIVTRLRFALEHFRNDPQPVLLEDAAEEIERLREQVNTIANAQDGWGRVPRLEAEIERLRTLGDALAATGGQHGFDEALDNWKEMRGD